MDISENLPKTNTATSFKDDDIDIGRLFRLILMQSKLIALITLLGTSIGIAYYVITDKVYKSSSLLQVYSNQRPSVSSSPIDLVLGGSNQIDLSNLEFIFKSRKNIFEVIDRFNLNVKHDQEALKTTQIFETIEFNNFANGKSKKYLVQQNGNGYLLTDLENNSSFEGTYGKEENFNGLKLNMKDVLEGSKEIYFSINNPEQSYREVVRNFEFIPVQDQRMFNSSGGLLDISYSSLDENMSKEILNAANEIFIRNIIETESQQASNAIDFIDQRVVNVEVILNKNKADLKNFQESNKSINVDLEIQSIIESIAAIDTKISEIDLKITTAETNYTSTNPFYIDLINQKNALLEQRSRIEKEIESLPLAQQEYIDLYREVEISQQIYSELINKRLEYSIIEASTLGYIRIIDNAYFNEITSPRIFSVLLSAFLSLISAILFATYRGYNLLPITNPAEIADNGVMTPIGGVLPFETDTTDLKLTQSIESLIVNINQILESKESSKRGSVVLITSPTPSNGKSFISRQLAETYVKIGKRVLLIDNDQKRGELHKGFEVNKIVEKDFKTMDIEEFKLNNGLYFIPRISKILNSFQFLYSPEYVAKIDEWKNQFDIILFDTPPLLSVSDTSILMTYSDINITVVRHGLSKINELKQLGSIANQIGINIDIIAYNAYEKPSSYYGYYGLYGNYAYQYYAKKYLDYSYDYEKSET